MFLPQKSCQESVWPGVVDAARCSLVVAALALSHCATAIAQPEQPAAADSEVEEAGAEDSQWSGAEDLLGTELQQHWKEYSSGDAVAGGMWKRVANGDPENTELRCSGEPRGFLHTLRKFEEFELCFEWRFLEDPNGNSGVLVFTQDEGKLWPTSIQVQLHQPAAGSVFPVGEAVTDATVKKQGLAREVGEWNQCRIVSLAGSVVVHINGEKAGEVTGCRPASGAIALQSEGSEVHFRRIRVRVPVEASDTPVQNPANAGADSLSTPTAS